MKHRALPYTILTFAACTTAALLLCRPVLAEASSLSWWPFGKKDERPTAEIKVDQQPLKRETRLTTSFASIIEKTAPSIVSVKTSRTVTVQPFFPFNDPNFRRFFGIPDDEGDDGGSLPRRRNQGLGSGVIVSADGYILTNNHVVDGADEIIVDLQDGSSRELTAKVVGTDSRTDIAVLKVDATGLPAAVLGDSDQLLVGDIVLAIGNPFGVGQTVTMGIVSAKGRNIGISRGGYEDFIQTDASINQGNSGGALIDAEGRVVGINTAILSPSGGNLGIGFAIPINLARNIMEQLIRDGRVTRGYLGVQIEPITPDRQQAFNLESTNGALVTNVEKDSAAAKGGLQRGDVITEVDGKAVSDVPSLRLKIASLAPGTKVKLKVIRRGKPLNLEVTLGEFPTEEPASLGSKNKPGAEEGASSTLFKGVDIRDLDANLRRQGNIPDDVKGAIVTKVAPNSPAAEAGMRPGQVIQEIGDTTVTNAKEAIAAVRAVKGKIIRVLVWDRGAFTYLVIKEK
jgi:serine protease Do